MQGLTEEQIDELKLTDEYEDVCVPSGGCVVTPDPMGRRNGRGMLYCFFFSFNIWLCQYICAQSWLCSILYYTVCNKVMWDICNLISLIQDFAYKCYIYRCEN